MNLLQLKQIVDKALEEQPELAEEPVFYITVKTAFPIHGLIQQVRLGFVADELIPKAKIWLP